MTETFDWNHLVPEPEPHVCNCAYCDQYGELEETFYPALVEFTHDQVAYVTDRALALRADLAPVPDDWNHQAVRKSPSPPVAAFGQVTGESATDMRFAVKYLSILTDHGWRLRHQTRPDGTRPKAAAIVDAAGNPIGLLMPVFGDDSFPGYRCYTEPGEGTA